MYKITWEFNEKKLEMDFENANDANKAWSCLKQIPGIENMQAVPPEPQRFFARVSFGNWKQEYTYLTHKRVSVGEMVVVETPDGMQIVKVKASGTITDKQLAEICPLERFKYIVGVVSVA